jgi:hypothetical protein
MTSSDAEVIPAETSDVTSVDATDVGSAEAADVATAEAADVATAEAADVATAEAADVTAAKATHVTSAKAATTVSATATAAGLRTSGKKAAGKHRACQYHHHSSSHDILHWNGRTCRRRALSDVGASQRDERQRRDGLEMGILMRRLY